MPVRKRKPDLVYYSEIFAPFQTNPINDVKLGYNGRCIADSIFYILNTRKGERLMLPKFGSNIRHLLFEPIDIQVSLDIEIEIREALERWEPRALIDDVRVIPDYDRNTYICSIKFRIKGLTEDQQEINIDFYKTFY